ncbi:MAG: DUF4252 domain-containing protein [Bacteroidales bacterium]|nr:DUF4252 domain-containing protein [Bacteroidales bacterium]
MKRFILIALAALFGAGAFAQDGKSIYNKYSEAENVSAVYISPAMFKLIGKLPEIKADVEDGTVDLAPVVRTLTGMYILSSENPAIREALANDVKKFVSSKKYELLMEAKDNGQTMKMYTVGDQKTVNSFVMYAIDQEETTFICIDGNINRQDLEKVLAEQMK